MFLNKNTCKIVNLFIAIFLCCEMQTSVTQNTAIGDRTLYYSIKTNSTEASFRNAQHHASVRLNEHDQEYGDGHICSGVIIGPSAILTTGQCVYNYNKNKPYHPSELKVVLASISRYQRQKSALVFSVTHSYQPKSFNALSLSDNVAILMLDRDIPKMSEHVKPIALTHRKMHYTNWYDKQTGDRLKVTTWLKTNEGLPLNQLMLFNATKVSHETCLEYYGQSFFGIGMLCVVSNEPLNKDFGSPLFIGQKLVGLRSFASGRLSPAIYTDVLHHEKWIRRVIGDGSNQNSSIWGTLCFLLLTVLALRRTKFIK